MNRTYLSLLLLVGAVSLLAAPAQAQQANVVEVVQDDDGFKLQVDGEDFLVRGMNWGYIPIGSNYSYGLWEQDEDFIRRVLEYDMTMLQAMGVNVIRQFADIPPEWVTYIYENYGIYTAVNNLMARYGMLIDGVWTPNVNYNDPRHREAILETIRVTAETYRDTPGVLMYLLGNENNYGLHWTSFEIEALPGQEWDAKAVHLYTLWGEAAALIDEIDPFRPTTIVNGDIQYLDLIVEHCEAVDIIGTNVYRGQSVGDLYQRVLDEAGKPVVYTEFGADAYNARDEREADVEQAEYLYDQWREIYEQSHGHGGVGNALGGIVFQWSDGWWKYLQEEDLDVHNTNASWPNGGYWRDFDEGQNNMNEEWFGITAKDPPDESGFFTVRPRTAYWMLQALWQLDPYEEGVTREVIEQHWASHRPLQYATRYQAARAVGELEELRRVRVSDLRFRLDMSASQGNSRTARGNREAEDATPGLQFDHTESVWVDIEARPTDGVYGRVSFNAIGNVADNRIDNIFYENRAVREVYTEDETFEPRLGDRFALYQAELEIQRPWFELDGYYRTGHLHWGYEGDYFGLYPDAYYGPNIDTYNGNAPFGFELAGRRALEGLKLAGGPEIGWGANPTVIGKYQRSFGRTTLTLLHQEDLAEASEAQSSVATPEPLNRRSAVVFEWQLGQHKLELAGLWSGAQRVGDEFFYTDEVSTRGYLDSGYEVIRDEVQAADALGASTRFTMMLGKFQWYARGSYRGLVNDGGWNPAYNITGWTLHESGRGNHIAGQTGFQVIAGNIAIAPNFLYQAPLVGPMPQIEGFYSENTGQYYRGFGPRNVLSSPFAVLDNRETIGAELLLVWDPTPATWFFMWDNIRREDAPFAASLDLVYRHQPTARDSELFVAENGATLPFGVSPPASDVWDAKLTWISRPGGAVALDGTLFAGQGQSLGDDDRLVTRGGMSLRTLWNSSRFETRLHLHDWGPYDYHRDFNLTYPLQWYGDLSWGVQQRLMPTFDTRFGLRGQFRTLDENSEGYFGVATTELGPNGQPRTDATGAVVREYGGRGQEFEVGVYVQFGLGGHQ